MAAATATNDSLWQTIRDEAQRATAADPVFGKSFADAVLVHDDFGAALADLIGRRLGGDATERARFTGFALDAFRSSPELIEAAGRDLQTITRSDPAIASPLAPLLHFKGYVALQAWRVSNWLWLRGHIDAALLFQNEASNVLQVSIHPAAQIGSAVHLDHAIGIVIGDEVTILQNVGIGRSGELPTRSPRVGRGVYIGAGASILGDLSIGDFAKIGAGTVVTSDVPGGCTAVGNPARLTNCPEPASAV